MTKCPFLRSANLASQDPDYHWSGDDCMRQDCELWNERFGRCSFAVDAYLKGQEDWRRDRGIKE